MTASTHTRRTVTSSLSLATTVEFHPRPPLPLLPPPWHPLRCLSQPRRNPERAPARYLPRWQLTRRRRYGTSRPSAVSTDRGKHINLTRFSCYRLVERPAPTSLDRCLACWVSAPHVVPYIQSTRRHSHTGFCEEPTAPSPPVTKFPGGMPTTGACTSSAAPLSQDTGACASSAAPSATGVCASGAALLSLGTGACAPSTADSSHAPHSGQTAASARRSFQRECLTPPPPGHVVAVGLRCGKADTEAPRTRVKLDSAFLRNSGGRYTFFRVEEEPARLATSSASPSRPGGRKPSPVDTSLPPTGGPLLKTSTGSEGSLSSSRTLTNVHVLLRLQWNRRNLTLPDKPVVTS